VQFGGIVQARHGSLAAAGHTWAVPRDGPYRFGIFSRHMRLGDFDSEDSTKNPRWRSVRISVGVL
jgi:hypothetical protein